MVIFHSYVSLPEGKFIHDSRCTLMKLYIATVEDCRMMSPGGIPTPLTPLKTMSSSVGMMKFPIYGKIKFMFQNHQPGTVLGVLPMRMTSFTFSYYLDPKSSNASQPKIGREQPLHPLPNENGKAPIQQRVIRLYPLLM